MLSIFTIILFSGEGNGALYGGHAAIVDEPEANVRVAGIFLGQRTHSLGGSLMGCNDRADGNRASFDASAFEYSCERLLNGPIGINDVDVLVCVQRGLYQLCGMFRIAQGSVHHHVAADSSGALARAIAACGEDYFVHARVCQRACEKLVPNPLGTRMHGWSKSCAGRKGSGVFREQFGGIIGV
ncbi:MAG TPA: hypothetical protein VN924_25300 [Bryobacteraceae bacterium]|nr:hypothetical protein [Bryobacteraceae bacterium]